MKKWLVVANAARARVLEETGVPGEYRHVADLVHVESRQKGGELASDRPGHVMSPGFGPGSAAYVPRTDPREHEHDRFALELATRLNEGIAAGSCGGLVLVASNPFLGRLKQHLSDRARQAVLRTEPHDYTSLNERELGQRLSQAGHPG